MAGAFLDAQFGERGEGPDGFIPLTGAPAPNGPVIDRTGSGLMIRPGEGRISAIVRIRAGESAKLLIVAEAEAADPASDAGEFSIVVNGIRLWRSSGSRRALVPVHCTQGASIDFCLRASLGAAATAARLRFAIFRPGPPDSSVRFERIDDNLSNLSDAEAQLWADGLPDLAELGQALLHDHDRAEIESGFGKSLTELAGALRDGAGAPPDKRYVIYFIPRSGSTALCETIEKTGRLGHPHEYLDGVMLGYFSWVLGAAIERPPNIAYLDLISRHCKSPNGVFGFEIDHDRMATQGGAFARHFEAWPAVYVTRRDVLAQGLSLFFASEGNRWSNFSSGMRDVEFDRGKILVFVKALLRQMRGFEAHFAARGILPLRIHYEEFLEDSSAVIRRLADHIGITSDDLTTCDPETLSIKVIRRAANADYAKRITSEGGEWLGYDFFEIGGETVALLAGLEPADLPAQDAWPPIVFRGASRDAVKAAIRAA